MGKLELILTKDGRGQHRLYACRGTGKGCKRNGHREKKTPCADCWGPLDENMTLGEVQERLKKGDA